MDQKRRGKVGEARRGTQTFSKTLRTRRRSYEKGHNINGDGEGKGMRCPN